MRTQRGDEGSAVVEFVLVATLVVLVVLALVQLSFALLVRNTLVAAATEGARFGAFQGGTPDDGVTHTRVLIGMTLPDTYSQDVTATYERVDGVRTVVVQVSAALPVVAWWGPAQRLTVQGHAVVEQP